MVSEPVASRFRTLLIVAGVVLALCCCGGVVFVINELRDLGQETGPMQASADSFFSAVVSGSDAYSQLCTESKGVISREYFDTDQARHRLTGYEVVGYSIKRDDASVTVRLRLADGTTTERAVRMVTEGGVWKVCGLPY